MIVFDSIDKIEYCIPCSFSGFEAEIYNGGSLSRCLRCRKATDREISAEDYFNSKNKI